MSKRNSNKLAQAYRRLAWWARRVRELQEAEKQVDGNRVKQVSDTTIHSSAERVATDAR